MFTIFLIFLTAALFAVAFWFFSRHPEFTIEVGVAKESKKPK